MSFSTNVKQKLVKRYEPFCTTCQYFLWGNGSLATPYECECGVYEYTLDGFQYVLKEEKP